MSKELVDGIPIEKIQKSEKNYLQEKTQSETNISSEIPPKNYLVEAFQNKENYEVFFEVQNGEVLKNFEVFKHYVIIEVISDSKELFKGKTFFGKIKKILKLSSLQLQKSDFSHGFYSGASP